MKYTPILLCIIIWSCATTNPPDSDDQPLYVEAISQYYNPDFKPFYHGVASGDPLADRVIIWTRVTSDPSASVEVEWEVATDTTFSNPIRKGKTTTSNDKDFTVKVDVDQLTPNTRYYYRFHTAEGTSVTGRTLTAPRSKVDSLHFAVASCSNYEWGYFNAYGNIARRTDLNAVLHLGDYIYEYQVGGYGDTTIGRHHIPPHEIISLEDYRLRYSQYRLDPDLMAAHQNHPFIVIWDDHEIANNAYMEGAQNHQQAEGDYEKRKAIARQVYYEWMPVRNSDHLYRAFHYGDLAKLIMLDERLAGRTAPVDSLNDPMLQNEERAMLGQEQMEWFLNHLQHSEATWKVVGNQVIYSYLNYAHPTFSINLDSWDGYPAEQRRIANFIKDNDLKSVVFVTGDTHSSFAFEAAIDPFNEYNPESGQGAFAVEFGTPSINSGNSDERFPRDSVKIHEKRITNSPINPHLKFANLTDHGYMILSLYPDHVRSEWYYVETLKQRSRAEHRGMSAEVRAGSTRLQMDPND